MARDEDDDVVDEILEDEDEEDEEEPKTKEIVKVIEREKEEKGFLSNLTKEDVILVILLLIIGVAIGYVIARVLGRKDRTPYMPVFSRGMDMPHAPPPIHNIEAPLAGRRHRGKSIDVETGDLILDEPHQQEYWVVKRNVRGEIIDLYLVDTDDELH